MIDGCFAKVLCIREKNLVVSLERILIIKQEKNSFEKFYSDGIRNSGVSCAAPYKYNSGLLDFICHVWLHFNFPGCSFFYGDWKKHINRYSVVIVFDWVYSHKIVHYIKKKNKDCRVIFWFWNPIKKHMQKKMLDDGSCEYWTFDENDAKKYHIRQNHQFYIDNFSYSESEMKTGVLFVGKDKGRYDYIMQLKKFFEKEEIVFDCNIIADKNSVKNGCFSVELSYQQVLEKILETKCVLDITNKIQSGLTIRALEAVTFSKLLITDNPNVKQCSFYNDKYIFVIGERPMSEMVSFLRNERPDYPERVKADYGFRHWLRNFL